MIRSRFNLMAVVFYGVLTCYLIVIVFFTIGYFMGEYSPKEPASDWWSALGAIIALTIAILIMNFLRESDYKEFRDRLKEYQLEIENTKKLSSLTTVLIDITSDENVSSFMNWGKGFQNIKSLYKSGFISSNDLYRMSISAIRQNNYEAAFKIRKLVFDNEPNNLRDRLSFLSFLSYFNEEKHTTNASYLDNESRRLLFRTEDFLNEVMLHLNQGPHRLQNKKRYKIDYKNVSEEDIRFTYAIAGRYLYVKRDYIESKRYFMLANDNADKIVNWHYRYLILLNFITNNFEELKLNLEEVDKNKEWREDYRYVAYQEFFSNLLRLLNGSSLTAPNKFVYLKALNIKDFERFSMWEFEATLKNMNINSTIRECLIEYYQKFYLFFGIDDNTFSLSKDNKSIERIKERENYLTKVILGKP